MSESTSATNRPLAITVVSLATLLAIVLVMLRVWFADPGVTKNLIVVDAAQRLAVDEAEWIDVVLPDDWSDNNHFSPSAWYRTPINLNVQPDRLWAVLLRRAHLNGAVYLNGQLIGQEGSLQEPISHNWNKPLLFTIPGELLNAGFNELQVYIVSSPPGQGALGRIYIGPHDVLSQLQEKWHFESVELSRLVSALSFMIGFMILGIWALRRHDSEYGWFALTALLWAAHSLKYHLVDIPVSSQFWAATLFLLAISGIVSVTFFLMRFQGYHSMRVDRGLFYAWLVGIALVIIPFVAESAWLPTFAMLGLVVCAVPAYVAFGQVIAFSVRSGSAEAMWVVGVMSFIFIFCLHDALMVAGFLPLIYGHLTLYAVPLLLLTFGCIMLRRFTHALSERETLLEELEARANSAANRIVELEKDRALAAQRETIMRDMHDGVGGQLISSLALVDGQHPDPATLRSLLQDALTDLRLMIDSLDADADDLTLLIGALRDRMGPILTQAGYKVRWNVDEIPLLKNMTPHAALQVLRVMQEAITNAIKHAHATEICVDASYDEIETCALLTVCDDGIGFDHVNPPPGRGQTNMARRVAEINAVLAVGPNPHTAQGTRVQIRIPLDGGEP